MPYASDDILITSADQIVPGSIIQAEMLVGYGDGNQLMVTHVMKVVAVDGETFSAVRKCLFRCYEPYLSWLDTMIQNW
ncbi:unnamed protein product [Allacma fusca]|uniref:Uncharacterized protein n=1 Tax=Allacma fusca TaxID=39272 RepID=A0A8J2L0J2_9HEXA|nr:unnamed protein product [Allacma fusca]